MSATKQRVDAYQKITDKVLALMEEHGTGWTKPWAAHAAEHGGPISIDRRPYRGINSWILQVSAWERGYDRPIYGTFKAWKERGYGVRKGEHGEMVVFFKTLKRTEKDKATGEERDVTIPMLRHYYVFNLAQVEPRHPGAKLPSWVHEKQEQPADVELDDDLREYVEAVGVPISHGGDRAFYVPSMDRIQVPVPASFKNLESYWATLLHELTHSTGHKSRLDRDLSGSFGASEYAREELVAELGAAFQCVFLGITPEPREDHAKYLNGWMQKLKQDKQAFMRAASAAQAAVDYILGCQPDAETGEAAEEELQAA